MKIIKMLQQHRRDFTADVECEGCGHKTILGRGYDDRNYHDFVLPAMKCPVCHKSRDDLGITHELTFTKYADYETV